MKMKPLPVLAASLLVVTGLVSGCSASVSVGDSTTSAAPAPDTSSSVDLTETITNDQYGFSFKYAPPFEPQEDTTFSGEGGADSANTTAVFDTEGSQIGGQYRDAFVVNVYELQAEITEDNLADAKAELENSVIPQLEQSTDDMKISEVTETTVAGKPAFSADATFTAEGKGITSTLYFVFDGNREYQVLTQAADENWDGLQPTFDAMLGSLTITGASASPSAGA
ncbi:MAG: PsbP-related protein [Candidatus Nanopelagicales bacterium]